ncbi:MAG TPA: NAD(P)/FAD-dependent oxidoreductase [Bacteroidia bacterium]|jgi:NADH dehydrogenase|nr:NAD(P)/FAD-dependent oxidoreductase [Bacteroidia bacterium]
MKAHLPETDQKRIVIIGGGFGGLKLARELSNSNYQVVLIDKNNYHQFQPLFYQVATAGLEPSSISFPFRKIFQKSKNILIRVAEIIRIDTANSRLESNIGVINYDYLVIAIGADTNFFGNKQIMEHAIPMKSVGEALALRNTILQNYEEAVLADLEDELEGLMNIVVVGGGPTGVEISGTLAEMKNHVLPKDYPELDFNKMQVYLLEGSPKVLGSFSESASLKANEYLRNLGVNLQCNTRVKDYDGKIISLEGGATIRSNTLVWAAGIIGNKLQGLDEKVIGRGNRILVDRYNKVNEYANIYAIGDVAYMTEEAYPNGHPQVAQVAIQQGNLLAKNFKSMLDQKPLKEFSYKDLGSMATIGRNKAVADLGKIKFHGVFAWMVWMFVHLMSIVGVKNKVLIFINWAWNYITFDQSLRLILKAKTKNK